MTKVLIGLLSWSFDRCKSQIRTTLSSLIARKTPSELTAVTLSDRNGQNIDDTFLLRRTRGGEFFCRTPVHTSNWKFVLRASVGCFVTQCEKSCAHDPAK